MSIEHISDEQIQEYLDAGCPAEGEVSTHIASCGDCREEVGQYKALYRALNHDSKISLPDQFAGSTMAKIRAIDQPEVAADHDSLWLWITAVASCLAAFWFLLGRERVNKALSTGFSWDLPKEVPWFLKAVQEMYAQAPGTVSMLVWAGLLLLGVALVDKLLQRRGVSKAHLFTA